MGRPNSAILAMRDPALAAAVGALPSSHYGFDGGADFGDEVDLGFGGGFEEEIADMIDVGFGAAAQRGGSAVHPKIKRMAQHTHSRSLMLEPNKYSTIKVEGYSFPINPTSGAFTLGTAVGFTGTIQPNAKIRPTTAITNVAWPAFVTLSTIQVANVNAIIGGTDDAASFSFLTMGKYIKLPPLDMSTRGSMSGAYTGFVPPGYTNGASFLFTLTLQGPSALAGNG